jgi:trans-aconitate methyltransferase
MNGERADHWEKVYRSKPENEVSWFEDEPRISLDLINAAGLALDAPIIDVGGGEARLVDRLIARGHTDLCVLDLSHKALDVARVRLGKAASSVGWIVADVTQWEPERKWQLWHDRAVFHFLTDADDRRAYVNAMRQALNADADVIIATFAPDGPERCSGLAVMRHDAESVGKALGPEFRLEETRSYEHRTPGGASQRFQYARFSRRPG